MVFICASLSWIFAMVKGVSDEAIGDHQRVQVYLKTLVSHFFSFGKPKEAEQAPCFLNKWAYSTHWHAQGIVYALMLKCTVSSPDFKLFVHILQNLWGRWQKCTKKSSEEALWVAPWAVIGKVNKVAMIKIFALFSEGSNCGSSSAAFCETGVQRLLIR